MDQMAVTVPVGAVSVETSGGWRVHYRESSGQPQQLWQQQVGSHSSNEVSRVHHKIVAGRRNEE
jgi:hypothetical protein